MPVDKRWAMNQTVEITKEYARGGGQLSISTVLKQAYETINELQEDASK
ncbi:MAG: hypothetical protein UZ19_OD1000534 [Parcubacteria bacterium OLB19]|nr:MAG: hypothetical protein UZ19_OD1000534 [Parcubacteria bacterium OLB19]